MDDFTRNAYQRTSSPIRTVLNDASKAWIATVTDTGSSMGDRVSGYTNVHHETYVIVEQYMSTQYGKSSPYGTNKKDYLPYLLTDEGTIDFTARMARMLADARTGSMGGNMSALATNDMAAIWGAWRAGINGLTCFAGPDGCGYGSLTAFQNRRAALGRQSQLGRPFFTFFQNQFYSTPAQGPR